MLIWQGYIFYTLPSLKGSTSTQPVTPSILHSRLGSPGKEDPPDHMLPFSPSIVKHNWLRQLPKREPLRHARPLKDGPHRLLREAVVRDPARVQLLVVLAAELVRHKVEDEEHPARAQPLGQLPRREGRVLKVVESRAHARQVKVEKLGAGQGRGAGVGRVEEVAYQGLTLVGEGILIELVKVSILG